MSGSGEFKTHCCHITLPSKVNLLGEKILDLDPVKMSKKPMMLKLKKIPQKSELARALKPELISLSPRMGQGSLMKHPDTNCIVGSIFKERDQVNARKYKAVMKLWKHGEGTVQPQQMVIPFRTKSSFLSVPVEYTEAIMTRSGAFLLNRALDPHHIYFCPF